MKVALVGLTYTFRSGLTHYTTTLYRDLWRVGTRRLSIFSSDGYPHRLFPGRTDRDPSALKLAAEYEYVYKSSLFECAGAGQKKAAR